MERQSTEDVRHANRAARRFCNGGSARWVCGSARRFCGGSRRCFCGGSARCFSEVLQRGGSLVLRWLCGSAALQGSATVVSFNGCKLANMISSGFS
ncbi:putative dentin sialophosphoprotein-like [Sesbania bispinosa]|nr:putative dentin sialophosphoprotein-like [Sesbania bispinosa]